jgi:hypothetical protein
MKRSTMAASMVVAWLGGAAVARAADHQDGPQVTADPSSDINDVFSWMSADGSKVYLAMTVFPAAAAGAKFSNATKYVFHATAHPSFLAPAGDQNNVICTFSAAQAISCWVVAKDGTTVKDYVTGDASGTAGISSTSGKVKVFAGLRSDPFFFNLDGFKDAAKFVHDNAATLVPLFDANGCPKLDANTSKAAVGLLGHTMGGTMPPVDHFATFNGLAIVMAVDKSLLVSATNPTLTVWASTNK